MVSCRHNTVCFQDISVTLSKIPCLGAVTAQPLLPEPLATTHLLPVPVDLSVLDISYPWTHTVDGFLCPVSFTAFFFFHKLECSYYGYATFGYPFLHRRSVIWAFPKGFHLEACRGWGSSVAQGSLIRLGRGLGDCRGRGGPGSWGEASPVFPAAGDRRQLLVADSGGSRGSTQLLA